MFLIRSQKIGSGYEKVLKEDWKDVHIKIGVKGTWTPRVDSTRLRLLSTSNFLEQLCQTILGGDGV